MDRVWCVCAVAGTSRTWKKNVALTEGFSKISGAPFPLLEQWETEQSDKTACPKAATKAWAETITGYSNFQLLPQKTPCFVTHLWFSISWTWRSPSSLKFTLQWAHLPQQDRTHENCEGWTSNRSWRNGYKRSWAWYAKRQNCCGKTGQGDTWLLPLGQDWSEKVSPCPLGAALASCIDLLHYCFLGLKLNHLQCHNTYQSINARLSNTSVINPYFSPARWMIITFFNSILIFLWFLLIPLALLSVRVCSPSLEAAGGPQQCPHLHKRR